MAIEHEGVKMEMKIPDKLHRKKNEIENGGKMLSFYLISFAS